MSRRRAYNRKYQRSRNTHPSSCVSAPSSPSLSRGARLPLLRGGTPCSRQLLGSDAPTIMPPARTKRRLSSGSGSTACLRRSISSGYLIANMISSPTGHVNTPRCSSRVFWDRQFRRASPLFIHNSSFIIHNSGNKFPYSTVMFNVPTLPKQGR